MKKAILTLSIFYFALNLQAQRIAQFNTNFFFYPDYTSCSVKLINKVAILKYQPKNEAPIVIQKPILELFNEKLFNAVKASKTPVFKEKSLETMLNSNEILEIISSLDTAMNCFGYASEPPFFIVRNEIKMADIYKYKVSLHLSLDKNNNHLNCYISDFAPLIANFDDQGNPRGDFPLFFFPITQTQKTHAELLVDPNITYAFQTSMRSNFIKFGDSTIQQLIDFDYTAHFKSYETMKNVSFWDAEPAPISKKALYPLTIERVDTFTSYKENIQIKPVVTLDHLEGIRFVHNWYFEEETARMYVKMVAYAPIVGVYDDEGNFRYHKPLYYIVPNE